MKTVSVTSLEQLVETGVVHLTRGKVISKRDIAAYPGSYPIYSSAKDNDGKFGEYGKYLYDEELITWSVDGGGRLFHRPRHKFSVTNVGGVLRIQDKAVLDYRYLYYVLTLRHSEIVFDWVKKAHPSVIQKLYTSIPVPGLNEQKQIAQKLDEAFTGIAKAKENAEKNLQNARALFESYLEAVFTRREPGWVRASVKEIAAPYKGSIRTGPFGSQLLHSEFVDTGIAVIGIDNAVTNEFRWVKSRFITPEKYRQLKRYTVHPGDVLITIMGTCGRCAVVPDDIPTSINTKHICCITLDRKKCLPEYLHIYFLYAPESQNFLVKNAKGSVMPGLNMGLIQDLPVILPPLSVQSSIVNSAKRLQKKCRRLGEIYEQTAKELCELKKSFLHEAFSGNL